MKGEEVKKKLIENGFPLKDVADLMGVTPQYLHAALKVEDIKTGVLERIAKAINRDVYFFLSDGEPGRPQPETTVQIPQSAMDIMQKQADSLQRRDDQITDLIAMLREQMQASKVPDAPGRDNATSAAANW